jgi:hypothetical protein
MAAERWLRAGERVACAVLIGWLQVVGVRTHSVVHHILHAAPLVVLLVAPASAARHFTGLLAGYLWVFMLGVVSPMLYNALIRGYLFNLSQPYIWLAPVAAVLAVVWAAANAAMLARRPRWFAPAVLAGLGLTVLFAWAHPYLSAAFEYPLDRTLDGGYAWALVLLLETAVVLAVPGWCAFRLSRELRVTRSFVAWQVAYWVFFVAAMVAGLLPAVNRLG